MKKIFFAFLLFGMGIMTFGKCAYCGSSSYGSGCYYSPSGKHEH